MMLEGGAETADALRFLAEESGNVDASGNFSIQVLNRALKRSHGVALDQVGRGGGDLVAGGSDAFVLNRSHHWFTVRRLFGKFWNLNSTLDAPEFIGDFYLSTLLAQFRADGYDVFVASPASALPPPPRGDLSEGRTGLLGAFHRVADLVRPKGQGIAGTGGATPAAPVDPWANAGLGHSLRAPPPPGSEAPSGGAQDGDAALARALAEEEGGGADDDGDDLAMAIAMSMTAAAAAASASSAPAAVSALPSAPETVKRLRPELPAEAVDDEPAARVLIRGLMGGGYGRLTRRFRACDRASILFDWLDQEAAERAAGGDAPQELLAVVAGRYDLLRGQAVLAREELGENATFESAGLAPSAALTVRPR